MSVDTVKAPKRTRPSKPRRSAEPRATVKMDHASVAERSARGKAARSHAPLESHAAFTPAADRPDPVDLLERQAQTRVKELVPIRYGRMLVSPFSFYRGAAAIMAADLAATPRSGLTAQVCGDAHISNFGLFASPERHLMFDVNDFDETLPGPWEWDVKRLAASLTIAGRENGFSRKHRDAVVGAAVRSYREAMRQFAAMPNVAVWYASLDAESALKQLRSTYGKKATKRTKRELAKARTHDNMRAFSKLTHEVGGEPRIISDPPLIVPVAELFPDATAQQIMGAVDEFLTGYRRTLETDRRVLLEEYRFVDLARKVVGVGSVGTRTWIALFLGRNEQDPLFLQVKEAQASVLEEHVGRSTYATHGERVIAGQHLMQAASDIFLGWRALRNAVDGAEYDMYVRQLKDWKGSAEIERMPPAGMSFYGQLCAWTLARAHARSGDEVAIAAYLGGGESFDRAITEYAELYADQNELDYKRLAEAARSGRVEVQSGL